MALSRVGAGARARGWRRRRRCGQLPAAARSLPLSSLQYRARSLYTDISPLLFISKPSFLSSGGGGGSGFIDLPERRARKRRVTAARQRPSVPDDQPEIIQNNCPAAAQRSSLRAALKYCAQMIIYRRRFWLSEASLLIYCRTPPTLSAANNAKTHRNTKTLYFYDAAWSIKKWKKLFVGDKRGGGGIFVYLSQKIII